MCPLYAASIKLAYAQKKADCQQGSEKTLLPNVSPAPIFSFLLSFPHPSRTSSLLSSFLFYEKKRKEEKKEGRREGKTEANCLLTLSVLIAAIDCGRPVGLHLPVAGIYCVQETSDAIYKPPLCCNVKRGVATQRGWGEGRGRRKRGGEEKKKVK
jgi:hypothetical protein